MENEIAPTELPEDDWITCDFCGGSGLIEYWDSESETTFHDSCIDCGGLVGWRKWPLRKYPFLIETEKL